MLTSASKRPHVFIKMSRRIFTLTLSVPIRQIANLPEHQGEAGTPGGVNTGTGTRTLSRCRRFVICGTMTAS